VLVASSRTCIQIMIIYMLNNIYMFTYRLQDGGCICYITYMCLNIDISLSIEYKKAVVYLM
jgi:hypothetical protein